MLEVKNITKIYGKGKNSLKALDDVSINFGGKGLVVILGKSGCGKSTLLNIMGGLDTPTSGEVIINSQSTAKFSKSDFDAYRNTFVGIVFQEFNLIDDISVFENINMTMKLQEKNADVNTVDEVLAMVGLANLGYRKPSELSGGQRQRVALARALLKKPEIILADEPTGALDSVTGEEVFESLKKIALTKLVIVVTHNRDLAHTYADRIVEIVDGKIVGDKIKDSGQEGYTKELSDNVIEVSTGGKINSQQLTSRMKKGKVNYIGISHDKDRIALAYPETVDSFYKTADANQYKPTEVSEIPDDGKKFKLSKGKLNLKDAVKLARENIKRSKKRHRFLTFLTTICFTFMSLALVVGMVNVPNLAAKSAFESNAQPLVAVGVEANWSLKKLTDENINEMSDIMGSKSYGKLSVLYTSPNMALYSANNYNSDSDRYTSTSYESEDFVMDIFNGVLEVDNLSDVGLQVVSGGGASSATGMREIIISDFAAWSLIKYGYVGYDKEGTYGIHFPSEQTELVGAQISFDNNTNFYTIVGIFDTNYEYYMRYRDAGALDSDAADKMTAFATNKSFLYKKIIAANGFAKKFNEDKTLVADRSYYTVRASVNYGNYQRHIYGTARGECFSYNPEIFNANNGASLLWSFFETEKGYAPPQSLADDEMIVTFDFMSSLLDAYNLTNSADIINQPGFDAAVEALYDITVNKSYTPLKDFAGMKIVGIVSPDSWEYNSFMMSPANVSSLITLSANYDMLMFNKGFSQTVLSGKFSELKDKGFVFGTASADIIVLYDFAEMLTQIGIVFLFISLGALVLAFLIIFNYMSASVRFRTKEIAVYRVIGAKSIDVAKIFLAEDAIIVAKTSVISILLSFIISLILNTTMGGMLSALGITFSIINFNWLVQPLAVILGCAITVVLSSLIPISSVTRKRPVEAVKMI